MGTTNEPTYLRDKTGGRRFWPIKVGTVDVAALIADRDQLFAEAVVEHQAGAQWWPDAAFEREYIAPEQEARYEADAWEDEIASFVATKTRVTLGEVARDAIGLDVRSWGTHDQRRVRSALIRLRWIEGKRTGKSRWWIKDAE